MTSLFDSTAQRAFFYHSRLVELCQIKMVEVSEEQGTCRATDLSLVLRPFGVARKIQKDPNMNCSGSKKVPKSVSK